MGWNLTELVLLLLLAFIDFDDYRDAEDAVRKMDGEFYCFGLGVAWCKFEGKEKA